MDTVTAHSLRV